MENNLLNYNNHKFRALVEGTECYGRIIVGDDEVRLQYNLFGENYNHLVGKGTEYELEEEYITEFWVEVWDDEINKWWQLSLDELDK